MFYLLVTATILMLVHFFFSHIHLPFIYLNHVFRSILEREEIRSIHWTATAVSLSLHTHFFLFFFILRVLRSFLVFICLSSLDGEPSCGNFIGFVHAFQVAIRVSDVSLHEGGPYCVDSLAQKLGQTNQLLDALLLHQSLVGECQSIVHIIMYVWRRFMHSLDVACYMCAEHVWTIFNVVSD